MAIIEILDSTNTQSSSDKKRALGNSFFVCFFISSTKSEEYSVKEAVFKLTVATLDLAPKKIAMLSPKVRRLELPQIVGSGM
jgi:hypothetical protein